MLGVVLTREGATDRAVGVHPLPNRSADGKGTRFAYGCGQAIRRACTSSAHLTPAVPGVATIPEPACGSANPRLGEVSASASPVKDAGISSDSRTDGSTGRRLPSKGGGPTEHLWVTSEVEAWQRLVSADRSGFLPLPEKLTVTVYPREPGGASGPSNSSPIYLGRCGEAGHTPLRSCLPPPTCLTGSHRGRAHSLYEVHHSRPAAAALIQEA